MAANPRRLGPRSGWFTPQQVAGARHHAARTATAVIHRLVRLVARMGLHGAAITAGLLLIVLIRHTQGV